MLQNFKNYLLTHTQITESEYSSLFDLVEVKTILKGEFLLQKGEHCKHSFFIENGLARFYSIDKDGKEHIIQFAPENWFVVDRASVFFNEPSEYYIDTIEDTTAVFLDENFFCAASETVSFFSKYNEFLLQNHIKHLQNRINLLLSAQAEERYLKFIKLYPDLTLRIPQWMIASHLGITPESLSRVRKELARKNFGR